MKSENATLKLRGMSCASCANNIEKAIRAVSGVDQCSINFGVEQASVTYDDNKTNIAAIQDAVDAAGYAAQPIQDDHIFASGEDTEQQERQTENRKLRRKVWVSCIISAITVIGSLPMMTGVSVPIIQMWLHNPWFQLALTTPVLFWGGNSFLSTPGKLSNATLPQ
jgi:P-type Cu+ transporter